MKISDLQSKTVAILGFGQEGQAIASYLSNKGINAIIYDYKPTNEWSEPALALSHHLQLETVTGTEYLNKATETSDVIFRSPGVKIPSDLQDFIKKKNIILTSQAAWFFKNSPAKIIGITGTKGKGTTSSLIFEIINKAISNTELNGKAFLTGNIGKVQPLEFLDQLSANDYVVYELSSFQLQDLTQSPWIGVTLMVTEDHLDYHSDLNEYYQAKGAISKYQTDQDFQVYNTDYKASTQIGLQGNANKFVISRNQPNANGAYIGQEKITIIIPKSKIEIDTTERLLMGKHNLENIAAGSMVGAILGVKPETIQKAVVEFKGLKHRLQYVDKVDGVEYYNDSISSIPDTTIAAIKSFSKPIVLILGGATKNLSYDELISELVSAKQTKAIVTVGETGAELEQQLIKANFTGTLTGPFNNFQEAFLSAKSIASEGDIVLLSPAATSFDMFKNYAERGDKFIDLVKGINNG